MGFSTLRSFHSFRFHGEGGSKRNSLLCDGLTFVQTSLGLLLSEEIIQAVKLEIICFLSGVRGPTSFQQTPREPESVTSSKRKQTAQRRFIECTVIGMAVTVIIVPVTIAVVLPLQR